MNKYWKAFGVAVLLGIALAALPKAFSTVSNQDVKTISALGNGATTNYTIGFNFRDNDDIQVFLQDESTTPYTRTRLLYGSGAGKYTITGGDPGTTVVMGTAPSSTQRVVIIRSTPITQTVDYNENSAFPAQDHENQMDKQVLLLQELNAGLNSKVGMSTVSSYPAPVFPDPAADQIIMYNHAGNNLTTGPSPTPVSGDTLYFTGTGWSTVSTNNFANGTAFNAHIANLSNPHAVTAAQVGSSTAQWNADKIQGVPVDNSSIGNAKVLSYDSGSSTLKYVAGAALPSLGTANQVLGVDNAGSGNEYKTIQGTSNQVTVTHGANSITLSAPQNLHSGASPTFAGATLTGFGPGHIYANASGVLSTSTVQVGSGGIAAGTITNNEVSASAAIAYSKLNLANQITNSDIATGASVAYTKLNLTGNIQNADLAGNIARAKLAAGTANHVILNDGSGVMTSTSTLTASNGGTGIPSFTIGDILYASGTNTLSKLSLGSGGSVLTVNAAAGRPTWQAASGGTERLTSTGTIRANYASVTATCSASPCTIDQTSGTWLSSITRSAAGQYTLNFVAGIFTSIPSCFFIGESSNGLVGFYKAGGAKSTSAYDVRFLDINGSAGDPTNWDVVCFGAQ